jgi:hypothetical protein
MIFSSCIHRLHNIVIDQRKTLGERGQVFIQFPFRLQGVTFILQLNNGPIIQLWDVVHVPLHDLCSYPGYIVVNWFVLDESLEL